MGHGGWEPDSVPIKSGPPRSTWNFQGDFHNIYIPSPLIVLRDIHNNVADVNAPAYAAVTSNEAPSGPSQLPEAVETCVGCGIKEVTTENLSPFKT